MGVFSNSFRAFTKAALPNLSETLNVNPLNELLSSINKYKSYLAYNSGVADSLISALTLDAELIHDDFIDNEDSIEYDENEPKLVVIDSELSQMVIDGLSDACQKGGEYVSGSGLTLSDGKGRIYNFIDYSRNPKSVDGYEVLISSTFSPSKVSEAILARDTNTGEIVLNNFIRTADFVGLHPQRIKPDTIFDLLKSVLLIRDGRVVDLTISGCAYQLAGGPSTRLSDIYSNITVYASQVGIEWTGLSMFDMLSLIYDYVDEQYPLPEGRGSIQPIWSLISDQIQSSQLNSFINDACDVVLAAEPTVAIETLRIKAQNSKYQSVRDFGFGCSAAYGSGGVYGLASYTLSYLKSLRNVTSNEDGQMAFTDNQIYVPQVYLSGIVNIISNVVSGVITVLATIVNPILGAAVAILSSVATGIVKAITYDHSGVRSAVNPSSKVLIPIAPYGILQQEIQVSSISNPDITSLLSQGIDRFYLNIPGGYVIFGPGQTDDAGHLETVRLEVHPSCADSRESVKSILQHAYNEGLITFTFKFDSVLKLLPWLSYNTTTEGLEFALYIAEQWSSLKVHRQFENQNDNRLSAADDAQMLDIVCCNTFICMLYLSCVLSPNIINITGKYLEIQCPSGYGTPGYAHFDSAQSFLWYALDFYGPYHEMVFHYHDQVYTFDQTVYLNSPSDPIRSQGDHLDWTVLANNIILPLTSMSSFGYPGTRSFSEFLLNQSYYYNDAVSYPTNMEMSLYTPIYDSSTFWKTIIITTVATAIVATAVVVTAITVKRKVAYKRAVNEANVATSYETFTKDPSASNYKAYKKAVKKNNRWASLIGGSKFDVESYWHGDSSNAPGSSSGSSRNPFGFDSLLSPDEASSENVNTVLAQLNSDSLAVGVESNHVILDNLIEKVNADHAILEDLTVAVDTDHTLLRALKLLITGS